MNFGGGHVVLEELHPLVPVPWVDFLRVQLLLVSVGLVSDVEDGAHQVLAKRRVVSGFLLLSVLAHLVHALFPLADESVGLRLQLLEHLFLLFGGKLLIE